MGVRQRPAGRRRTFDLAVVAAGVLLVAGLSTRSSSWPDLTALGLFAALLVFAENSAVALPTTARMSPSFMVVMASIAAFQTNGTILGAALVGASEGLAIEGFRRRKFFLMAFNSSQHALSAAAAAAAYQTLHHVGAAAAFPIVAAAVVFAAVNVALVLPGVAADAGVPKRVVWAEMAPALPNYLLFGLLGTLIGELYRWLGPISVVILVSPMVVARTVFLAFMRLRHALRRMEMLYGFTRRVGADLEVESVVHHTLAEIRRLFGSDRVELLLIASGVDGPIARTVADAERTVAEPEPRRPTLAEARVLEEGQPFLDGGGDRMVVPVYGEAGWVIGVITAGEKAENAGAYSAEDLKLLETLANHASVAFANGRLVERLRHDSLHDALTGLGNRTLFQQAMDDAVRSLGDNGLAAVMLLDLDRFKEVNDTLGHESGDLLLQQIALRLTELLGDRATIARLGGDEFAILLPLAEIGAAGELADAVLTALQQPFTVGELRLEIGASIGVALAPVDGDNPASLLQRADVAMYAAKDSRTGWELYSREHDRYSPRRLVLAADLRHALERRELETYYQPKADLRTGQVTGVEALLRWNHPEYGFIPPDEFIPIAEHTGLIRPLTSWVLREAITQCRRWGEIGYPLSVAVNLSVRSLMDAALPEEVAAALASAELPATSLILEITESTIMADPNRAIETLSRLADQGVSLAIDDFGTGYSSLAYLKRLPVHEVKVDRSFVMNLANDQDDVVIVRSTVDLARNLGLRVVAEGVEDAASWDQLRVLGCDSVQGYHLARPMPAAALTDWLAANYSGKRSRA